MKRPLRKTAPAPAQPAPSGPPVRTSPEGTFGRVYGYEETPPEGSARPEPKMTIHARLLRAGASEWEDLGQIASPSPS